MGPSDHPAPRAGGFGRAGDPDPLDHPAALAEPRSAGHGRTVDVDDRPPRIRPARPQLRCRGQRAVARGRQARNPGPTSIRSGRPAGELEVRRRGIVHPTAGGPARGGPAAADAAGRRRGLAGCCRCDSDRARQGRHDGVLHRDRRARTGGTLDGRARRTPADERDPASRARHRHACGRRRQHGRVRGPGREDLRQAAAADRGRDRPQPRTAPAGLPHGR